MGQVETQRLGGEQQTLRGEQRTMPGKEPSGTGNLAEEPEAGLAEEPQGIDKAGTGPEAPLPDPFKYLTALRQNAPGAKSWG